MSKELWLDCSGSYAIVPDAFQVAELRALGFTGAIVGSSYSRPKALLQIEAFKAGGMQVQEYQFPSALKPTTLPFWTDAELPDATLDSLRNALRIGSVGPYSRRGWALDNLPNWDCKSEFPASELWDARYVHGDGNCLIQQALGGGDVAAAIAEERSWITPFKPYWGFERAKVTQWHNSITIAGVNMDLNDYEPAVVISGEDEDMKPFLVFEDGTPNQWLVGFAKPILIGSQAEAAALAVAYGPPTLALTKGTIDQMAVS